MLKLLFVAFLFISCSSLKSIKEKVGNLDSRFFDKQARKKDYLYTKWAKNLDPNYNSGNRPIGSGSPLIVDDMIFMGSLSGSMNAYSLSDGSVVWSQDEKQVLNSTAGYYDESVFYGSINGRLFSRKYISGKLNYAIDLGSPIESAPVFDKGKMFVHLRNHKIVALDAKTGKIFWTYNRSVPFKITLQRVSKPLIFEDSLIVGFADGHLVRLTKNEGIIKWDTTLSNGVKFVDVDLTPVLFKKYLVAGSASGNLSFINPRNGFVVKALNTIAGSSPIVLNDELIVGSIFGEMIRFDSSGQIIKKSKVSEFPISSVVSWYGQLAVSTMGEDLIVLDPFTLDAIQSKRLGTEISSVFGGLSTDGEFLALYSSRNRLYIYRTY